MTMPDDLLDSLVSHELLQVLKQHGVHLAIRMTDVHGHDVSPEVLDALDPALAEANVRLTHMRQLATLGELSATMVHEARNMLTGILGLSLVRRSEPPNLELLRKESARCSQLLNTFLSFAARAAGYPTVVRPFEMAEAVSLMLSAEAKVKQCTISVLMPKDFPELVAPSQELRQVLVNLTLNAIQASPEGGCIALDAEHVGSRVHLTVTDEGTGVPEAMLETIFEPFVSSKPPTAGTGLGLSTARRLVESMSGTLSAANRAQGGACFTVSLPRDRALPKSYFPPAGPA